MILFDAQPTSLSTASFVSHTSRLSVIERLTNTICHRDNKLADISTLLNDASLLSSMIAMGGYKNILVLPTPITEERLRNKKWEPTDHSGDLLFPIVHQFCGAEGKVSVAVAKEGHLYEDAWKEFNVNTILVDNWFSLDRTINDIDCDIHGKFDAIVLMGNRHSIKRGTFQSNDIKKKFRTVCTPNFDMIDVCRKNSKKTRIIKGKKRDLSDFKQRFLKFANTSSMWGTIYTSTHKLPEALRGYKRHPSYDRRRLLTHFRFNHNIEQLETFYKVFK